MVGQTRAAEVGVERKEPGAGKGATVGADGENARRAERKMASYPQKGLLGDQIQGRENGKINLIGAYEMEYTVPTMVNFNCHLDAI